VRTRYTIDADSGLLVDRNGAVLGRVVGITIDDGPVPGYGAHVSKGESSLDDVGSTDVEPHTPIALEKAAATRLWAFWIEHSKKRQRYDSKRERILRSALATVREVYEVELTEAEELVQKALLGVTRSPFHKGANDQRKSYMEIRYALKGIGNESDDERIEKAIGWASLYAPEATQMPEHTFKRLLENIRTTLSSPSHPEKERGKAAWRELTAAGFNVVPYDKPPWARAFR
jgi:hypothetical protein